MHFVLDEAGACLLAAEDGITPGQLGYRRDRALAIALSAQLAHTAGTNSVFCALAAQGRRAGGAALTCWWSERRCAALWGDLARPDGYGQWTEHAPAGPAVTDFFLEYDTGSENLHRVAAKLTGYRDLAARTGITTPVLFWLPDSPPRGRPAGTPGQHRRTAARARGRPAGSPACPSPPPRPRPPRTAPGPPARSGCPPGSPGRGCAWPRPAAPRPPRSPATGQQADDSAAAGTGLPWHPPAPAPPPLPGGPGTHPRRQR